jgi:hypothetical protein
MDNAENDELRGEPIKQLMLIRQRTRHDCAVCTLAMARLGIPPNLAAARKGGGFFTNSNGT